VEDVGHGEADMLGGQRVGERVARLRELGPRPLHTLLRRGFGDVNLGNPLKKHMKKIRTGRWAARW
jgi:hypothetical protein